MCSRRRNFLCILYKNERKKISVPEHGYGFKIINQLMKKYGDKVDVFEFAYAITTHLSQGSQYNNVVFLNERTHFDTF